MKHLNLVFAVAAVGLFAVGADANTDDKAALRQAKQLYERGDFQQSLALLAPLNNSADPSIHLLLGQCEAKLGYLDQAKSQFQWCNQCDDRKVRRTAERELQALDGDLNHDASQTQNKSAAEATPPRQFINDSARATVRAAAKLGWRPCNGRGCLNFGTPGWHHQAVPGHPATDQWMTYDYRGGHAFYNQAHIGHVIQTYADRAADVGICPVCQGLGWIR